MKKYSSPHLGYFDVVEACKETGCPICRLSSAEVKKYLDAILYDCVTDPDIRDELRLSLGYCHTHAWQLSTVGRGYLLGISIIYEDVLDILQSQLPKLQSQTKASNSLVQGVKSLFAGKSSSPTEDTGQTAQHRCPACLLSEQVETQGLKVLAKSLDGNDDAMHTAFKQSEGLCLRHLRQGLAYLSNASGREILLHVASERITEIRSGLKEFIRKNDHRFQHEPIGGERDSWKHAISFLVGAKDKE